MSSPINAIFRTRVTITGRRDSPLALCHFDPNSGADLRRAPGMTEDCEAACYSCLMSYSNQRDHELLDRATIKDYLLGLADRAGIPIVANWNLEDTVIEILKQVSHKVGERFPPDPRALG